MIPAGANYHNWVFPESEYLNRTKGDLKTWDCGLDGSDRYGHDRWFRHRVLEKYPDSFSDKTAASYIQIYHDEGRYRLSTLLAWMDAHPSLRSTSDSGEVA